MNKKYIPVEIDVLSFYEMDVLTDAIRFSMEQDFEEDPYGSAWWE